MKFFVKHFPRTIQARVLIFGSQVHDALLYRWIENQSFQEPFKLECSFLVCRLMMTCYIVGLRTNCLLLNLPYICPSFFPSILWRMKFFVKDFSRTMQARIVIFGSQVYDALLYCGIENHSSSAYSSLYLSNFLSFHTLRNEIFRQRFLNNHAS